MIRDEHSGLDLRPWLVGRVIRLQPLGPNHTRDLWEAFDRAVFAHIPTWPEPWTFEAFDDYMRQFVASGDRHPLAMVLRDTGRAVGTSCYFDVRPEHRGLEIGHTLIAPAYQGTAVNPESKYLMLRHAFETLGLVRVQLKTDGRNLQSQRAIARLGAEREGVLRKHMILQDGRFRDTVMFSITDEEWPAVRAGLEARLGYAL